MFMKLIFLSGTSATHFLPGTALPNHISPKEIPLWSDYKKSLPGDFIRFRLKIKQNCRLFLDIFNSAIMNDLFMTFTSRLKVDAKCNYTQ